MLGSLQEVIRLPRTASRQHRARARGSAKRLRVPVSKCGESRGAARRRTGGERGEGLRSRSAELASGLRSCLR